MLDTMARNVENFHLVFLLKLSRLLGFGANQARDVIGIRGTTDENEALINDLIRAAYTDTLKLTNVQRREILELILRFYDDHMGSLGEWKSITVLREVLG
jgi:DNA repair protein RecO (recombination protein O)